MQRQTPSSPGVLTTLLLVLAALAGACGGTKHALPPAVGVAAPPPDLVRHVAHKAPDPHAPAVAHAVATIDRRSIGPFLARTGDAGIVAWVTTPPRGQGQELDVVPLGPDGSPLAAPAVAATLADGVTTFAIRPAGGIRRGWLAAWSSLMDRGEALTVLALDERGAARGSPVEIVRTSEHLSWFDFVPTRSGVVCSWAEETTAGVANLVAVSLDPDGKAVGVPARVARGVARWDMTRASGGAAAAGLALVDLPDPTRGDSGPGRLAWELLDADAKPRGPAASIGAAPSVSSDVDVVPTDAGWLLGWTDKRVADPQVTLARIDGDGRVQGPSRPLELAGNSSLVGLVAGPAGAMIAWESARANAHPSRELHLAEVPRDGVAASTQKTAVLEIQARSTPELAATDSGFALLVTAKTCFAPSRSSAASDPSTRGAPCEGPLAPMLVRLTSTGTTLEVVQTEPVLLGADISPASLAWGLRCAGDRCIALAADAGTPTTVYTIDFAPRASPFAAPLVPAPPADAPRLTGVETIASGPAFADLATTRAGDTTFLAALALPKVDARDRGQEPSARTDGAIVSLSVLDASGHALAPTAVVSSRAVGVGGLALAAAARADDGVAVAWVKRDAGDPQVHVARFDRHGKRLREVQLTSEKGDASSVSIVAVEGGWVVAWVDGRDRHDGHGEVYAARVDTQLDRASHEERITTGAGDASDVALAVAPLARSDAPVWLAWSDSRDSPGEGLGDIYVTQLRQSDARRTGDESRVLATARHSRTPQLVAWPLGAAGAEGAGGATLGWLEEGPAGIEGPAAFMTVRLDGAARRVGEVTKLPMPSGSTPTAVTLAIEDGAHRIARAVVARATNGAVTLEATRMGVDGATLGATSALLDLEAAPPFDVALSLSGDAVLFDDAGGEAGKHRIRRAAIDWRKTPAR